MSSDFSWSDYSPPSSNMDDSSLHEHSRTALSNDHDNVHSFSNIPPLQFEDEENFGTTKG
jgi:hypothetical protein